MARNVSIISLRVLVYLITMLRKCQVHCLATVELCSHGLQSVLTHYSEPLNALSVLLTIVLILMFALEPTFWCNMENAELAYTLYDKYCKSVVYWEAGMATMRVHWALLIELSGLSTTFCSYVLVCSHALNQLMVFLTGLGAMLVTFTPADAITCSACIRARVPASSCNVRCGT